MEDYTKRLIERRALQLAKVCEHVMLDEDLTDEITAAGFRWGYLILRKPKRYLEEFRHGTLLIDQYALKNAFWNFHENTEGPEGMMPEEEMILEEFNEEALKWMKDHPRTLKIAPVQSHRDT